MIHGGFWTVCALAIMSSSALWCSAADPQAPANQRAKKASTTAPSSQLRVAVVQMRSSADLEENLAKTTRFLEQSAKDGARVVVFPECSVTGYIPEIAQRLSAEELAAAEQRVADACKRVGVYAIVGMPWRQDGKLFNAAVVITPQGRVIERFFKMQLVEDWPSPGDHLSVFPIDGTLCTIIICHDERYPELVRLPVLAGARVVFYISHESGVREEHKIDPYRAQIQARAVENGVFIAHSNAPANKDASGSHGQSRLIAPDGRIIQEASIFDEEVITTTFDLAKATRGNAKYSLRSEVLRSWWEEGLKLVRRIGD
jgi:predicted amidohydrolase